jgi:hypothetical protein
MEHPVSIKNFNSLCKLLKAIKMQGLYWGVAWASLAYPNFSLAHPINITFYLYYISKIEPKSYPKIIISLLKNREPVMSM